jgi:hypothetical protein
VCGEQEASKKIADRMNAVLFISPIYNLHVVVDR